MSDTEVIRYSADGTLCIVWSAEEDRPLRVVTQWDMDHMPVGADLSRLELAQWEGELYSES